jgi:hypothetical protein
MGRIIVATKLSNIIETIQEITPTDNPTTLAKRPTQYYMEMLHILIARPLKPYEPTTNPTRLTKVGLKQYDESVINLVDYSKQL